MRHEHYELVDDYNEAAAEIDRLRTELEALRSDAAIGAWVRQAPYRTVRDTQEFTYPSEYVQGWNGCLDMARNMGRHNPDPGLKETA